MKNYLFLICLFLVITVISCKNKDVIDPYGDPKYFVKVAVISNPVADGYNFALNDGTVVLLKTDELTNNNYPPNYQMREMYPLTLRVLNWEGKYLYWDSDIVATNDKYKFELPLVMDSDKKFRVLMSTKNIEKYFINIETPINSGISVYVQDKTSESRYIDVFTNNMNKIAFIKGMNITVTATNSDGSTINKWQINTGDIKKEQLSTDVNINDISADYELLTIRDTD